MRRRRSRSRLRQRLPDRRAETTERTARALRDHGLRPGRLDPRPEPRGAGPRGRRHRPGRVGLPPARARRSRAGASPGIGFDRDTLREAGIEEAYAFAAVSSGDNSNILAARVARETFGVENVVARIYDPGRAEVYQRLGIPTVATVRWTADQMLRRLLPHGARAGVARPERQRASRRGPASTRRGSASGSAELEEATGAPGRLPHPARRGHAARRGHRAAGRRPGPRRHARGRRRTPPRQTLARPAQQRRSADAGRHRRRRQRRPLDRARAARATATRSCSSTRTRRPSSARRCPAPQWLLADACEIAALEEAGLHECQVVVAATGDDKVNLVVSLLAKTEFGVPRTVARVNNPKNEWMFDEAWGVDVAVSTPRLMTALVEEAVSVGDLVRIFTVPAGQRRHGRADAAGRLAGRRRPGSATWPGPSTRCWSRSSARAGRSRRAPDDPLEAGRRAAVRGHARTWARSSSSCSRRTPARGRPGVSSGTVSSGAASSGTNAWRPAGSGVLSRLSSQAIAASAASCSGQPRAIFVTPSQPTRSAT